MDFETLFLSPNAPIYIFYVLTANNELRKYVFDTSTQTNVQATLVNVWDSVFSSQEDLLTLKVLPSEESIVFGTSIRVIRMRTSSCEQYQTERHGFT